LLALSPRSPPPRGLEHFPHSFRRTPRRLFALESPFPPTIPFRSCSQFFTGWLHSILEMIFAFFIFFFEWRLSGEGIALNLNSPPELRLGLVSFALGCVIFFWFSASHPAHFLNLSPPKTNCQRGIFPLGSLYTSSFFPSRVPREELFVFHFFSLLRPPRWLLVLHPKLLLRSIRRVF